MKTQRSSSIIRASSGAREIAETTNNEALSIAAAETTLGRPLSPEEVTRLEAVNSMLKDRSKLAALLSSGRATKPTALTESVESPDHDILDFLHLPDTIPVRSIILILAEGIPVDDVNKLFTSHLYEQLKTAFMESVRHNGTKWLQIMKSTDCYSTKLLLLWDFARLCTAEVLGIRERSLQDMAFTYSRAFNETHAITPEDNRAGSFYYKEVSSPLDQEPTSKTRASYADNHFNVNTALHELGLTKGEKAWQERLRRADGDLEKTFLDSLSPAWSPVMLPLTLAAHYRISNNCPGIALDGINTPWLSSQNRQLLADEALTLGEDNLPSSIKNLQKHDDLPAVQIYEQLAHYFAQKGDLYEWIHALARKMPGEDEKQKIERVFEIIERQIRVLKLLVINASKLRIEENLEPNVATTMIATAFTVYRNDTFIGVLLRNGCEIVDGVIVPHEETNGVKATVVEVMTAWKVGNSMEKEKQSAAARAKVAEGERLVTEKNREDQELDRLISECEAAHAKIDEMIRGPLAKGLSDLVISLQDADEAKRIFRGCGGAAVSDLKQDLECAEGKHWFAKRFDSSAATKKISRLRTQLALLTSLWEDESCHFETASVEPLEHSENRINMKTAVDAAEVVAITRTIAKNRRLEFTGDALHTFRQLMADFMRAYKELQQQIETMKSKKEGDNGFQTKTAAVHKKTENVVYLNNSIDEKSDLTDTIAKLFDQRRVGFTAGFEGAFKEAVPNETDRWRNSLNARRGMSTSSQQIVLELCKDADKI